MSRDPSCVRMTPVREDNANGLTEAAWPLSIHKQITGASPHGGNREQRRE
jgi:hypothetical protein